MSTFHPFLVRVTSPALLGIQSQIQARDARTKQPCQLLTEHGKLILVILTKTINSESRAWEAEHTTSSHSQRTEQFDVRSNEWPQRRPCHHQAWESNSSPFRCPPHPQGRLPEQIPVGVCASLVCSANTLNIMSNSVIFRSLATSLSAVN